MGSSNIFCGGVTVLFLGIFEYLTIGIFVNINTILLCHGSDASNTCYCYFACGGKGVFVLCLQNYFQLSADSLVLKSKTDVQYSHESMARDVRKSLGSCGETEEASREHMAGLITPVSQDQSVTFRNQCGLLIIKYSTQFFNLNLIQEQSLLGMTK